MWRFALWEGGRFALGLFGAALLAAGISALSVAGGQGGGRAFLSAMAGRLLAFLRLDFGTGAGGQDVLHELVARSPTTLALVLLGAVIAFLFGVPLGLLLSGGPLRRAAAPLIQIVAAAPVFCAGLALALIAQRLFHRPAGGATALLLAALTVGLAGAAAVQLALRRAAAEIQYAPFRLGLRQLGLPAPEIDRVYVAPLVFAGAFRGLGDVMLALLSATLVAEGIFKCPGLADLFLTSVALRDWNAAALVLFAFAGAALLADFAGRLGAQTIAAR